MASSRQIDEEIQDLVNLDMDLNSISSHEVLRGGVALLKSRINEFETRFDLINVKIKAMQDETKKIKDAYSAAKKEVANLKTENAGLNCYLDNHEAIQVESVEEANAMQEENEFLVAQNLELQDKIQTLEKRLEESSGSPQRYRKQAKTSKAPPKPAANSDPNGCFPSGDPPRGKSTKRTPLPIISSDEDDDDSCQNITDIVVDNAPVLETASSKAPSNKPERCPPITIAHFGDWGTLHKKLRSLAKDKFTAKSYGESMKITFQTIDDYRKVVHFLEDNKIHHVAFPIGQPRQFRVVLKRVHESIHLDDVVEELAEKDITVSKISRLRGAKSSTAPALILLQMKLTAENQKIYSIAKIMDTAVIVAAFDRKKEVVQCYNCQGFHHGSTACRMPTKCLKCGEGHRAKECPLAEKATLTCANCQQNHPSNYRGCPKFPKHHPTHYAKLKNSTQKETDNSNKNRTPSTKNNPQDPSPNKDFFVSGLSSTAGPSHSGPKKLYSEALSQSKKAPSSHQEVILTVNAMLEAFNQQMLKQMQSNNEMILKTLSSLGLAKSSAN